MRHVSWLKAALREFEDFPENVRRQIAFGLDRAAEGGKADNAKPLHGLEGGVFEVMADDRSGTYRTVYAVKLGADNLDRACLPEEIRPRHQDAATGHRLDPGED